VLGAHVGVEHVTFGVTGIDGRVQSESRVTYDGTWDSARSAIAGFVAGVPADPPVLGLGVIVAGQVDPDRGTLIAPEAFGWKPLPMRDDLTEDFEYPLFADSSVRAHATADILFGVAEGVRNFVHVFVGNVIEIAVVVDGVVIEGREGVNGDLSHWMVADEAGRAMTAIDALGGRAARSRCRSHRRQ
jgi:predicted NBD/HSP70 family sugar kinase